MQKDSEADASRDAPPDLDEIDDAEHAATGDELRGTHQSTGWHVSAKLHKDVQRVAAFASSPDLQHLPVRD